MAKATKKKPKPVTETHDGTTQGKQVLIEKLQKEIDAVPWVVVGYTDDNHTMPKVLDGETNFDFWLTKEKSVSDRYKVEIAVTKL